MTVAETAAQLLDAGKFPPVTSKSGLARLLSCDPGYVTRLFKRRVIAPAALNANNQVDTRAALQGIVTSSDPARNAIDAPEQMALGDATVDQVPDVGASPDNILPRSGSFHEERARRERVMRMRQEVDLEQRLGNLVDKGAIQAALTDLLLPVTTQLMQIGPKIADELAAESDPARCRMIVDHAVRDATKSIANGAQDLVARLEE